MRLQLCNPPISPAERGHGSAAPCRSHAISGAAARVEPPFLHPKKRMSLCVRGAGYTCAHAWYGFEGMCQLRGLRPTRIAKGVTPTIHYQTSPQQSRQETLKGQATPSSHPKSCQSVSSCTERKAQHLGRPTKAWQEAQNHSFVIRIWCTNKSTSISHKKCPPISHLSGAQPLLPSL